MNEANARFKLENARVIRLKELPKVAFLTVLVQAGKYPDYQEVVCFQPAAFPLTEGTAVTISGELQKKKPKEQGGKWELELIARKIERGDDAKAPRPRNSGSMQAQQRAPMASAPDPDDDLLF